MLSSFDSGDMIDGRDAGMVFWPLPVPSTKRWTIRRKADLVAAVTGGLLTVDEVCDIYSLSIEEFTGWQRAVDRSGVPGLRVTRIRQYREIHNGLDASVKDLSSDQRRAA